MVDCIHYIVATGICPMCARRRYNNLHLTYERRGDEINHLKRSIAALKGAKHRKHS